MSMPGNFTRSKRQEEKSRKMNRSPATAFSVETTIHQWHEESQLPWPQIQNKHQEE